MIYLTCPLCLEEDYDRVGLAMHYQDCHVAEALVAEYRAARRAWEVEHSKKLQEKTT